MSDITMCNDTDCPNKDGCKRFTSSPSEYQYYFVNTPRDGNECKLYLGTQSESIMNQLLDIVNEEGKQLNN